MAEMTLIEAPGRTVPQADGQPWPDGGLTVPLPASTYIRRRLRDGDLIEAAPVKRAARTDKEAS